MGITTPSTWPNGWAWSKRGGMLRIGLAHYNTAEEVDRLLEELRKL